MTFRPGQSGNPTGRAKYALPDGRTVGDLAREHTVEAFDCALTIMRDDGAPPAARASIIGMILDRGWGRAPQSLSIGSDPDNPLTRAVSLAGLSEAELRVLAKIKIEGES